MANRLMMKALLKRCINAFGLDIVRLRTKENFPLDFSEAEIETIRRVQPFTMTSPGRIVAAIRAAEYVALNAIPGSIVECGVWRGGSMMAMALTLLRLNRGYIPLSLFDTFEGMTRPTLADGKAALEEWERHAPHEWCFASLADVRRNLENTGYDQSITSLVQGEVERTLPGYAPAKISLLRLDTDWYESTKHELTHLFPRLSPGGVLIIDDYECWEGCRRAVDEYIRENKVCLFLNRIDGNGRIGIKL